VRTKGSPKVEPVCATVTEAMIMPRLEANVATAREIRNHVFNTKRALDIAPDARACDEYGGCPFKAQCGISGKERIVHIMSDFKSQPATQQFLQGIQPGQVNPPTFAAPQGQPSFPVQGNGQGQPTFAAPQGQPTFPVQQGGQGFPVQGAPQGQPTFAQGQPAFQGQPTMVAPPQQPTFPVQGGQPAFQAPQGAPQGQPAFQAPQGAPQGQPAFQAPQGAPQGNFTPPTAPAEPQAEEPKGRGRPKSPKEYDITGAWVRMWSAALPVVGGDSANAAKLADLGILELKARQ
jgi:hypothetical protein